MTKAIIENYINNVYLDYLFEVTSNKGFASILILDSAKMHLITEDFNPYSKNNIYEVFMPI